MSKDTRHYDLIVAPLITEKATIASDHNQYVFHVRPEATKPQIKAAIEKLFDVKVTAVNTLDPQGQGEDVPRPSRPSAGLQEGGGDARRRSPHRRDDGRLRTTAWL